MSELVSKVAVVTGGASGIGLGVARRLLGDGHRVAVLDRDGAAAKSAAADLRAEGPATLAVEADVADRDAVARAFERVRAELGPVAIVVTSAGIDSFDPVLDITPQKWEQIIGVNLTGTFTCIQAGLPDMVEAGWGRVVTISSTGAQSGGPNIAHYAASKGGVISLTKALAVELAAHRITANTVSPSLIDTPMARQAEADGILPGIEVLGSMVPLGRVGTTADVAAACAFLCSEEAGYITGAVLGVNGGAYV